MTPSFLSLIQSRRIQSTLISNFFIWLIPGILALGFLLFIIFISLEGGDGSLLGIEIKTPKGFLSFLSLGLILSGLGSPGIFVAFHSIPLDIIITIIFFAIICILMGSWMLNKEVRRLYSIRNE